MQYYGNAIDALPFIIYHLQELKTVNVICS